MPRLTLKDLERSLERIEEEVAYLKDNIENVIESEWQERFEAAKEDLITETTESVKSGEAYKPCY